MRNRRMGALANSRGSRRENSRLRPCAETLECRALLSTTGALFDSLSARIPGDSQLTAAEVGQLLQRAAAVTSSEDGIIAVVDRGGRILGVRVEAAVAPNIQTDPALLTFAIDGALAEARTGAFFGNNNAPLTSRTVNFIAQTTMTQRVVESNPSITDPNSPERGPGFVAPIGLRAHFPPNIQYTPEVDLFAIEYTNRDSIFMPGADRIRGTADDVQIPNRFNVADEDIPSIVLDAGLFLQPPESYGLISGLQPKATARGIGTLPGGIPIFKNGAVVGGIGVFFPGTTGFATAENSVLNDSLYNPHLPDRSLEAEYIAFAALNGSKTAGVTYGAIAGIPPVAGVDLPFGRIDLVGITLDIFGPGGREGVYNLARYGKRFTTGDPNNGTNVPIDPGADAVTGTGDEVTLKNGLPVPEGWLVTPHDGIGITKDDVIQIVQAGLEQANVTRAAIRVPVSRRVRMVYAVTDSTGEILGLYRTPDATVFSVDVAVAKARNVTYYADAAKLQTIDQIPGIPKGTAFTNRTFRYASLPRFPQSIDNRPPGPFSILNDGGSSLINGSNIGAPLPASDFVSVQGYDAFHPGTNFRETTNPLNQNGIVFFPGSMPLYKDVNGDGVKELVGGFGVSGDGVDQDDVVTFAGSKSYRPPDSVLRADQTQPRGVRLPFTKFNRNPRI